MIARLIILLRFDPVKHCRNRTLKIQYAERNSQYQFPFTFILNFPLSSTFKASTYIPRCHLRSNFAWVLADTFLFDFRPKFSCR